MFTVRCAGHGSRVILGTRAITHIDNTDHGIELHWRCPCGTEGLEVMGVTCEGGNPVPLCPSPSDAAPACGAFGAGKGELQLLT